MREASKTPRPKAAKPRRAAFAAIADAPDMLLIDEVAAVYRVCVMTVRRQLKAGTFRPLPIAMNPFRWHREDVQADLRVRLAQAQALQQAYLAARARDRRRLKRKRAAAALEAEAS